MLSIGKVRNVNINNSKSVVEQPHFTSNPIMATPSEEKTNKIPQATFHAYNNISLGSGLNVSYSAPSGIKINSEYLKEPFETAQKKLRELAKNKDSWINLPTKLLNDGTVDTVYQTMDEFKKPFGKDTKLMFVALGNPANADETINALGLGHNVKQCCEITGSAVQDTINELGGDLDKIQILISSKSGTTFESNKTYKILVEKLTTHYRSKGVAEADIPKEISKHFLCLTDKNPSATLKKEAIEKGYKTIDCVDNLASGFGDLAYDMPLWAYVGVPKETVIKMLKTAEKTNQEILNKPFENNLAGQIAAFDKIAIDNGAQKERFIFHGSVKLPKTVEQLYCESLRLTNFTTSIYPRDLHSRLESDISTKLPGQLLSNITNVITKGGDKTSDVIAQEKAIINAANKEGHWQKTIAFDMTKDGSSVKPEALSEYLALKSNIAFFKNELEQRGQNLEKIDFVGGYKIDRDEQIKQMSEKAIKKAS